MNQELIAKFIASKRKEKHLTQNELAEILNVTDRAVSKWENGRGLPDASLMIKLCDTLGITVNELLCGRKIELSEYKKVGEENLVELSKENEDYAKKILYFENFLVLFAVIIFAESFYLFWTKTEGAIYNIIFITSIIFFVLTVYLSFLIETNVGYYECSNCHHKYKPRFKNVFFSTHLFRTRRLKCPNCSKKTWSKKVTTK